MNRAKLVLLLSLIAWFAQAKLVHSEETIRLFIDQKDCTLKQVGFASMKNPLVIKGKFDKVASLSGCTASVEKDEFEKQFKFCFLSGVSLIGTTGGSCEFSFYDYKNAYLFEISPAGDRSSLSCTFTCIKK